MENSKRQVAGSAGEQRTVPCTGSEVIATTLAKDGASPNLADVEKRLMGIHLNLLRLQLYMKCRIKDYELSEATTPRSVPKRKSMHTQVCNKKHQLSLSPVVNISRDQCHSVLSHKGLQTNSQVLR
ncbi:hypothetical protein CDAR_223491 [Caerostris darwini]|uniref:Uncharacterized protein n=1 Tax=Caerostris darwini TaxID=1538125 RepID=A0AAV4PLY4_9ARAC|nr:hypothetical protein CDAR_223491 [Caerostris darwini]